MDGTSPHPHPAAQQPILEWEAGWGFSRVPCLPLKAGAALPLRL